MLKIGLFTFGGGYAMIALLENEFVSSKGWIDKDEFMDVVAISESTPGPIAINSATYIGYKTAGFLGAVFATVGMCLPSLVIIYLVSLFLDSFLAFPIVEYAFRGIRACVVYLIISAGLRMFGNMKKRAINIIIFTAVLVSMISLSLLSVKFSAIFYILICGALGLLLHLVRKIAKGGEGK